mmetsp:Transcript_34225/g.87541  ORF Transcript_34225/g.87541 Transcript_34225/m.87541 type:complete len:356 (+) Transcript_34225:913-1980(+)
MNTMPSASVLARASFTTASWLISRSVCASSISGRASLTVIFFFPSFLPGCPSARVKATWISCAGLLPLRSMAVGMRDAGLSYSTVRLSSSPSRSRVRNDSRVWSPASPSLPVSRSSSFSSTAWLRLEAISRFMRARVCTMAFSTRSRMIWSTSRPWYPTSVNLVASTLTKGASASLARRRAISVLPQPVGPIIRMFFGTTSWRRSSWSRMRRQRLRSATATAFFASAWPMMNLSSSLTTVVGVNASSCCGSTSTPAAGSASAGLSVPSVATSGALAANPLVRAPARPGGAGAARSTGSRDANDEVRRAPCGRHARTPGQLLLAAAGPRASCSSSRRCRRTAAPMWLLPRLLSPEG